MMGIGPGDVGRADVVLIWSTLPTRPGGLQLLVIWYYQRGAGNGYVAVLEFPRVALRDKGDATR